jgi:hypothetical protein
MSAPAPAPAPGAGPMTHRQTLEAAAGDAPVAGAAF